ncbi:MAG: hypothetical protein QW597_05660 [Thermoplasmataceae archaeon]
MFKHIAVGAVITLLLLGGSSIALADSNTGDGGTGLHFTYTLLSNGNVSDVAYGNLSLASNVNATGFPVSQNGGIVSTKTMTLFGGQDSKDLWFGTAHQSMQPLSTRENVTMALALATDPVFLGNNLINTDSVELPMDIKATYGWNVYSLSTGNYSAYLLTNGKVYTQSGKNVTFYSNQLTTFSTLMVGFIMRGDVQTLIQKYSHEDHENAFTYNQTTGNVTGRFVNFNFNRTTGLISNFTANQTGQQVFSSITGAGIGNFTSNEYLPAIRTPVLTVGGLFVYNNGSIIYAIHNNPALESKFLVYNGTISFTLSSNLTASQFSTPNEETYYNTSDLNSNLSYLANVSFGYNHRFEAGHMGVLINNSQFYGFLLINNGNLTINGKTLTVSSSTGQIAGVSFVAPEGLQRMGYEYQHRLSYAFAHRQLAGLVSVSLTNTVFSNITMSLNSSVNLSVSSTTNGKVALHLSSAVHTGTNIAVFISDQVINSAGKMYVYLDGTGITLSSYDNVINSTSSTNAYYAVIQESTGTLLVVHVPHFSNHTLVISSTPISNSGSSFSSLGLYDYLAIGAVVAAIAAVASIMAVRRKRN